jgi:hypothetical protein
MPAVADIDADAASDPVDYASETKVVGTIPASGLVDVAKLGIGTITGSVDVASTVAQQAKYLRFDLTNALFDGAPTLKTESGAAGAACAATAGNVIDGAVQAGGDGASFVTFLNQAAAARVQLATCDWVMTLGTGLKVDPTATATMKYSMYETLGQTTQISYALSSKTVDVTNFVAGSAPTLIVEAEQATATVASDFRTFDNSGNGVADGAITTLAFLDAGDVVSATQATKDLAGNTADKDDFLTAAQTITITGDVSQGVFSSQTSGACDGTGIIACVANADNTACTITATAANADAHICANFTALGAGLKVNKGAYSIAYGTEAGVTGALGSIGYDTSSVEIPYITTYADYNQRIFVDNRGGVDGQYSTTFTTESGITAVAGAAGTGTLTAGEITVIRAADLVTFTGGTRGTATLELEANAANLKITTQIVDLGTGMTDTILLHPSTQQ